MNARRLASDGPQMRCGVCDYDMTGGVPGGVCPECGCDFDTRPDWIGARMHVRTWLITLIVAIVSMPFFAPVGLILVLATAWEMRDLAVIRRTLRIKDRDLRDARMARRLVWVAAVEFVLVCVAYSLWFGWW